MSIEALAQYYENELSKSYLLITAATFLSSAGITVLIFALIGISAITVIEAIGTFLFFVVIGLAVIQCRKHCYFKDFVKKLDENQITAEQFKSFIEHNPFKYELTLAEIKKRMPDTDQSCVQEELHAESTAVPTPLTSPKMPPKTPPE